MSPRQLIPERAICLELKGQTKESIIEELVDLLVTAGRISDREAALRCVLQREQKMSTGMQHGIAIPHGKTDTVTEVIAAMGIKRDGVDFGSLDGEPSRLFVLTVSPQAGSGPHIQFLAEISRLLSNRELRDLILKATTRGEVARILASG